MTKQMQGPDLSDKVAVVTGASRGLGRRVAIRLAAQGAAVMLVARGEQGLAETAQAVRQQGGAAATFPADLSDPSVIAGLEAAVHEQLGRPSILVNAAGVFGPIELVKDSDPKAWIDTLMINTVAAYLTCRAFVAGMIDQGWGRIVNVSSAASLHTPGPLNSAYATSKVALNQFTRNLAAEVSGSGVTANVIHPGDVKTEMWGYIRDEAQALGQEAEGFRQWAAWVAETGGDDPEKAADLVLNLMAVDAASVSGQFLWIEGGLQTPIASWEAPPSEIQP
jgi:NAD(P)-dependent dehydrogenase (short-subunit alcohol dehydrogenase family)